MIQNSGTRILLPGQAPVLVLVRHGHRDTFVHEADNGLSPKGQAQAQAVREYALRRFGPKAPDATQLISSLKKRCIETIEPLAQVWKLKIKTDSLVTESGDIRVGVKEFLRKWAKSPPLLLIVSSHGDWIPEAGFQLTGASLDCKKGSWTEFIWTNGQAHLSSYVADPKIG